jgi:DNA-binding PadR family transcriptional regulator
MEDRHAHEEWGPREAWAGWGPRGPRIGGREFDLRWAFGPGRPFGPGGPGGREHGRGRGRGGRGGNVRAAILTLLLDRPMHGYEMIQELDERTGGMWRPSPGSVYPTLQLLEDEGMITSEQTEGKRRYSLTTAGRERAEAIDGVPWRQHTEGFDWDTMNKLRGSVAQLMTAFGQLMHSGTDEQKSRAADVLSEARRKLYSILADEEQDVDVEDAE